MHIDSETRSAFVLVMLALFGGCALPVDETTEDEPIGAQTSEIRAERSNGIAEIMASQYLKDPGRTLASYATMQITAAGGCSGTMIGPNVLMTAAHCGPKNGASATFSVYRNGSASSRQSETFTCDYLLQTFDDTDLTLFYCPPDASGVSPGDRYGWLDFDASERPVVGQDVYSVWSNPVTNRNDGGIWHMLYSRGEVQATDTVGWFVPGYNDESLPIGITTNVWTFGGGSGSAQLDARTNRVVIGPTSTGGAVDSNGNSIEAASRNALSIRDYLLRAKVDSDAFDINSTRLTQLGLTPGDYRGYVDADRDLLFDVQEDLERLRGENARSFYWLDFDSPRRNRLWARNVESVIHDTGHADVKRTSGAGVVLRHSRLNLASGTYLVRLYVGTRTTSLANGLAIRFANSNGVIAQANLATNAANNGLRTVRLDVPTAGAWLEVYANGPFDGYVRDISIVREGTAVDFDTYDQRAIWYNPTISDRSFITPDGVESGARWAGYVYRPSSSSETEYTLRTRNYPLQPSQRYSVCFSAKTENQIPGAWAIVEARSAQSGAQIGAMTFEPRSSWGDHCFVFTAGHDTEIRFGIQGLTTGASATQLRSKYYRVDHIRFVRSFI